MIALVLSLAEPAITVTAPHRQALGRPLADAALATMRGGLQLPNGLTVALGIDIQTWVDGRLALHSIYANEGICQFLFLKGDSPPEVSYADRAGKYMHQRGVALPKL